MVKPTFLILHSNSLRQIAQSTPAQNASFGLIPLNVSICNVTDNSIMTCDELACQK